MKDDHEEQVKWPRRVLYLDDAAHERKRFAAEGAKRGWEVTVAAAIEDAEHALSSARFDLLVADFLLEQGNSLEFVRKIRGRYATLPILVYSGWMPDRVIATGKDYCIEIVSKLDGLDGILEVVRNPRNALERARRAYGEFIRERLRANGDNVMKTARELDLDPKTIRDYRDDPDR